MLWPPVGKPDSTLPMSIEIRQHTLGKDLNDFIRAAHVVFAGDPNWVAPLDMMLRRSS